MQKLTVEMGDRQGLYPVLAGVAACRVLLPVQLVESGDCQLQKPALAGVEAYRVLLLGPTASQVAEEAAAHSPPRSAMRYRPRSDRQSSIDICH